MLSLRTEQLSARCLNFQSGLKPQLLEQIFFEVFLRRKVYRNKKASDRRMAPFRRAAASAWLRVYVVGTLAFDSETYLNGFREDSRSKNPADSKAQEAAGCQTPTQQLLGHWLLVPPGPWLLLVRARSMSAR